jgi:hypothetical protein
LMMVRHYEGLCLNIDYDLQGWLHY